MRSDQSDGEQQTERSACDEDARNHATRDSNTQPDTNAQLDSDQKRTPDSSAFDREEQRKLRRLQLMMDMVMSVIGQDNRLTVDQAAEMVADSKRAALAMFPDKELAYNLIYKPRLQRLMRERFRIQ